LQTAFTGPIATGLALVAIVVGGLMFAFGEGAAKRTSLASYSVSAWPLGQ
jgi:type IV secretory pathway VirB2 component (pilin)